MTEPQIMNERGRLISLGYRLLGSLADAEDVVQETYARWYALTERQRSEIDSPGAWLMKVAGRVCLDQLRSARARRERYVGEWIPEPLPEGTGDAHADPADRVTLDESLNMAFLVVLDAMTSAERVAFILHDVYRYPFAEVAEIVGRTPAACRQLATSARRRIRESRAPAVPVARRAAVVRDLKRAWEAQDIGALIAVLDPDVRAVADGGGLATALPEPIEGAELVARHLIRIAAGQPPGVTLLERTVSGQPGLVMRKDGAVVTVIAFDVAGDRISRIWAVRNPEKLRAWE
nr:RNA polymerase sigma factor SigJ [uncultured Actinoplanes sp.]